MASDTIALLDAEIARPEAQALLINTLAPWIDFALATAPGIALICFAWFSLFVLIGLLIVRGLFPVPDVERDLSKFPRPPSAFEPMNTLTTLREMRKFGCHDVSMAR